MISHQFTCPRKYARFSRDRPFITHSHQHPYVISSATSADGPRPQQVPAEPDESNRDKKSSRQKTSASGYLFLTITMMWSALLIIPMLIAHPMVLWLDRTTRKFQDVIAMIWMKLTMMSNGMVPKVINAENLPPHGEPVVYVANHSSYLDIYAFAFLNRRIKYLSKAEIFKIPIIGWAMRMAGYIGVKRMNKRGQMEAYRKMVTFIRSGLSLVIFPEGTRSETGKLRKFQGGAFRAAKSKGVRIVPITILGTRDIMPSYAFVPLRYPTSPIKMIVHPPIDSTTQSVTELQDSSFKAIDSALPPEMQTRPLLKHK